MSDLKNNTFSPIVIILGVTCIVLAALDISLALKVRHLNVEVGRLTAEAQGPRREQLAAGQVAPPMVLQDPQGGSVPVSFEPGSGLTLLLLSSRSCQFCKDARPIWDRIASEFEAEDRLRIVEIVLETAPEEIEAADSLYEVYLPGGGAKWLLSRIQGVPTSVLIDEGGVLRHITYGEQTGLGAVIQAQLRDAERLSESDVNAPGQRGTAPAVPLQRG